MATIQRHHSAIDLELDTRSVYGYKEISSSDGWMLKEETNGFGLMMKY